MSLANHEGKNPIEVPRISLQPQVKSRSLSEDIDEIRKAAWWVALLIQLPTIGFQAALIKALDPGKAGTDEALTFIQIFMVTAPLCIAVTIFSLGLFMGWYERGLNPLLTAVACLIGGVGVAAVLGLASNIDYSSVNEAGTPPEFIAKMLQAYLELYGAVGFMSSIAVGVLFGYTYYKLGPHLES